MASDSWASRFTTSSRRYQTRSDLYDETETEEDLKAEYLCPFCGEDFDVVGLFCHIDEEHPAEAKNGRKRRLRKGGANSAFSILRKELREGSLQSLLGGSSCFVSSSNTEPDPLLSPFIFNPPGFDETLNAKPLSSVGGSSVKGSTTEEFLERKVRHPHLSDEDQEKSRKSEFVQGLLLSTILDDEL
ncbi:PREDICTED: protein DEHYDRATION-INDUCED 19 homolog 4-like isoform X2 [Populus euphratica]|uniref:Protein DEHYDRATION-INDUCED 19 homolog 4-like isoform X2 n=1 Tax=Populus euphratica TaxID=75702 RepID=A0AAJ6V7Q1_POPEU|nr:PREDICTED: protein DEHYDRATION-INDUCED 19 homolog 4-like isoform X2 [Populus euphratica]